MELVDFRDTCRIYRATGKSDRYGNPLKEMVYDGACLYEEGRNTTADRIIVRSPLVFLPANHALIYVNDEVDVKTSRGRVIRGFAAKVRDITMKFRPVDVTRIELKQGMGD